MEHRIVGAALAVVMLAGCATGPSSGWSPSPPSPRPPVVVPPVVPPVVVPVEVGRNGTVRLEGRAFADGDGQFNAFGVTLFWALWGEKHDPERLERNLAHLAEHDVDFVRILSMVGAASWEDRRIDPEAPDYWQTADALFARLKRHRLRAQVVLFADAQVMMPDAGRRAAWVTSWAEFVSARREQVQFVEVANEYWQNGFSGDEDGVRRFGRQAAESMPVPVALSAPPDDAVFKLYAGWTGLASMHYDRDTGLSDGPHRPIRQPYGCMGEYREREHYEGPGPVTCVNNEPIGPGSSVASDDNPERLAMAFVTTFVVNNAGYVYHTGAGIRGGGQFDLDRGRRANLFEYDESIIRAMGHWRRTLPAGLANGQRRAAHLAGFPWSGSSQAVERGDIIRAYGNEHGGDWIGVFIGVRRPHEITALRAMTLTLWHPVSGDVVAEVTLPEGGRFTVPATASGYVVRVR